MEVTTRYGRQKLLTLLGSMFLIMPGCVDWLWGDISVYVFSYVLSRQPSNTSVDVPWVVSLFTICWIPTLTAEGVVTRFIERRWLVLVVTVFQDLSFFMCHFAIQNSLTTLNITFSVLTGITQGFMYGNSIHIVMNTSDTDEGFLSSMLLAVTSLSGLLLSQVSTWYVNPQNESPNWTHGSTKYFTQRHIIDKVPSMFLIIAGLSLFSHTIGLLLLQANPDMRFFGSTCSRKSQPTTKNGRTFLMEDVVPIKYNDGNQAENLNHLFYNNTKAGGYTPTELLKTFTFYVLWISAFMCEFPYILLLNYYKLFGQIWIRDDHFLTYLGTTFMLLISVSRVPWGIALDKFNCQYCLMSLVSVVIVLQSWYYFTAMVNRWMYFFTTCVYGVFSGAYYSCFAAIAAIVFGKQHVSTNTGLLLTSALAANLCAPLLINAVRAYFGWFPLFAGSAGLNVIGLFLICCSRLSRKQEGENISAVPVQQTVK